MSATACREAQSYDLWACALTRQAYTSLYDRQFATAVSILDLAAGLAQRGDRRLATRNWVAAVHAEVFAGLGDAAACERALAQAAQVCDSGVPARSEPNSGWLRFDGSRLAEERGTCLLTLGRVDRAEAALTEALREPLTVRRRAGVLVDLAVVGVHQRDVERVVTHGEEALFEARRTGSTGVIGRKLLGLQERLSPLLSHPRVSRLSAEVRAFTVRSTF